MRVPAGSTDVSVYFYIVQDASATSPGEPVTGLLFSDIETGGSASYVRQGAARTDLTLVTLASASAAHTDGGFILVDDTNMPGLYRCDYPDAAFAAGVDVVICSIVVASAKNAVAAPVAVEIEGSVVQTGDSYARLGSPAGASVSADIADVPTVAEFNARTLASADYFDPATDTVANVTTVATVTGGATAAAQTTAQNDLDTITGTDGVTLATTQANYAPAKAGDNMGSVTSVTGNVDGSVGSVVGHTPQTGDSFARLGAPTGSSVSADIADVPTVAEFEARTPTAAQLAYIVANAATGVPVTFTTSGGSTTAAVLNLVDGSAASSTNDQYNGRLLVFNNSTLNMVVTDITDYDGATKTATITAIPTAPTATHTARLI